MQRLVHVHSLPRLGATLCAAILAVYTGLYLTRGVRDPGPADGHYSFFYARSLAFDGDLDFRNDYAVCGDPYAQGIDRGTGRIDNPGYPGPAIVWVPLLTSARWFVRLPAGADAAIAAGCRGPIARAVLPQGGHFIHLAHAHPFLLLFAPQGGLFYATPGAYLAFAGIAVVWRDSRWRPLAIAAAMVIVATLWISSAALDWHGKATFGARRLIVLTPLFVVLSARALEAAFARMPRAYRSVVAGSASAIAVASSALVLTAVAGTTTGRTPLEDAPLRVREAGRAYQAVAAIGELAVIPARAVYAARFRMPMRSFGLATTDLFYRRSYREFSPPGGPSLMRPRWRSPP
jgi:hypothetical protein